MLSKICTKCGQELPAVAFNKDITKGSGLHSWCKLCQRISGKQWWSRNKEACLSKRRGVRPISRQERKIRVLTHYGNGRLACVVCGFDNVFALSLDHIGGGGNKHRREEGLNTSDQVYSWVEKRGYPKGFQTLCMNCQFIKKVLCKETGK